MSDTVGADIIDEVRQAVIEDTGGRDMPDIMELVLSNSKYYGVSDLGILIFIMIQRYDGHRDSHFSNWNFYKHGFLYDLRFFKFSFFFVFCKIFSLQTHEVSGQFLIKQKVSQFVTLCFSRKMLQ